MPPVRAERHRVHTVGLAGEDAVKCGCLGGQTLPGSEGTRRTYVTGREEDARKLRCAVCGCLLSSNHDVREQRETRRVYEAVLAA